MKPKLNLVRLTSTPIYQQLQWEEALLRADRSNWCIVNQGSSPAIVLGISGKVDELIRKEYWERLPIPLVRRFSGGGTVAIDENTLFVTLICQTDALNIPPFPRHLMQWTADKLYSPLFSYQPFKLEENDYVFGERKWGGNAQSITKGRWLHHSSLLWDYRPEWMEYLAMPPKTPAYRQGRTHADFLCRLQDFWSHSESFQEKIIQQLDANFEIFEKDPEVLKAIALQPHRKVTSLIW